MDKASGVYYYTIDNSIRPSGQSLFGGIVPMFTVKGPIGRLVTVTAKDFRDILGYDLEYNPNYLGLDTMLQSVARLEVLRLNQNSYVGNHVWVSDKDHVVNHSSVEQVSTVAAIQLADFGEDTLELWVAHKTSGYWGEFGVWFTDEEVEGDHVFTIFYGQKIDATSFKAIESKVFSFDKNAANYWGKVALSNIAFGFKEGATGLPFSNETSPRFLLDEGDNGDNISDFTVDLLTPLLTALDESSSNVIVGNGFSAKVGVCSALVEAGEKRLMSVFIDTPDLTSPVDVEATGDMVFNENDEVLKAAHCVEWTSKLVRSEYCQPVSVPDVVETSVGEVYIWPSVNLFKVYASMYQSYGHVRYPPAGPDYGSISISKLLKSDFHLYGNELKTARVNYQKIGSKGPVMWEQRTTYGLDSDLSYASTVFILRDLRFRLAGFMENFNFRFMTPNDLLSIRSGLDSILKAFKRELFLVGYTLTVPSYKEAQAAGRELDIYISVSVINDAEVINLRVTLENAAALSA